MSTRHIADTNAPFDRKVFVRLRGDLRLGIVFVAICVVIAEAVAGIRQEQPTNEAIPMQQLGEIAIQMKSAETTLRNLKVRSELYVDESADPNRPLESWQQTPVYVSSTMWSDGQPGGKIRVDVHKQVLRWLKDEKTVSYSERSFSQSFDGTTSRSIVKRSGELGSAASVADGPVTAPGRHQYLDEIWCRQYSGRYFAMNFFRVGDDTSLLSDLFDLADDPNSLVSDWFDFKWERLGESECIKIIAKESRTQTWSERWWLDPARGFALLRHEYVRILEDKTEEYQVLMEIQELKQVGKEIWWPMSATHIVEPLYPGKPYTRLRYHASEVAANDPAFDDGVFAQVD